jgi:hypothetical protein
LPIVSIGLLTYNITQKRAGIINDANRLEQKAAPQRSRFAGAEWAVLDF